MTNRQPPPTLAPGHYDARLVGLTVNEDGTAHLDFRVVAPGQGQLTFQLPIDLNPDPDPTDDTSKPSWQLARTLTIGWLGLKFGTATITNLLHTSDPRQQERFNDPAFWLQFLALHPYTEKWGIYPEAILDHFMPLLSDQKQQQAEP